MTDLPPDERRALIAAIQRFFADTLDEPVGDLRAALVLDFFLEHLGPAYFNRGVAAARVFMEDKLLDLEALVHQAPPARR